MSTLLSITTEYALRAVVWLASREGTGQTVEQISQATQVPAAYLSKVLQTLGRAGILRSQRGTGGGFSLARPSAEIQVLEVIETVEPLKRIDTCPLGLQAHGKRLCPLHARLDAAVGMIQDAFCRCSVRDLLGEDPASALCSPDGALQIENDKDEEDPS